jgi:hypothetical protein
MDVREAVKFGYAEYLEKNEPISDTERELYSHYGFDKNADFRRLMFKFPNGYGASVIRTPASYGGNLNLWELAVIHGQYICYDSGVTSDIVGSLNPREVNQLLTEIYNLQPKQETQMKKLFIIRKGRRGPAIPNEFFQDKMIAKQRRDELGSEYVVSYGPDHKKYIKSGE